MTQIRREEGDIIWAVGRYECVECDNHFDVEVENKITTGPFPRPIAKCPQCGTWQVVPCPYRVAKLVEVKGE